MECDKSERESHSIETKFITKNVNVFQKPDGRIYLQAKDQSIKKLVKPLKNYD